MQISTRNNSPQFGALHIANAGNLKLYKITDTNDRNYLSILSNRIKTKDLMPNLSKAETERWDEMLQYAVNNAYNPNNITYLETFNNKPCGIITFRLGKNLSNLDCITTFPVEIGKKVKLAGKTLFYQLFKDFQAIKGKKLELEAITNGPFDTIKKYESLGFKKTSNVNPTKTVMEINSSKIDETFKKLGSLIDYEPVEPEKVNLRDLSN